jgi:hypothetical protein
MTGLSQITVFAAYGISSLRRPKSASGTIPDFNRMRGEIFFTGALDKRVGIEFTKRQVSLDDALSEELGRVLIPTCRSIKRGEANRRVISDTEAKEHHKRAASAISQKARLLMKPPPAPPAPRPAPERSATEPAHVDAAHVDSAATTQVDSAAPEQAEQAAAATAVSRAEAPERRRLSCEIREEKMGPGGQIYECEMEGKRLILRYNVEHPFYQRFVTENVDNGRNVTATDFLIYSLAAAELRVGAESEANLEAISTFKGIAAANLRTLLN